MIEYLWTVDDHEYRHERYRVQLAFMLQLFCFSGARAGAIVESSSYRGTNEAITYKVRAFAKTMRLFVKVKNLPGRPGTSNTAV